MSGASAFLDGGGHSGARMRAANWAATPLGLPERWPRSLKTVVRIALDSRYAMWLAWGPELTFFCNDAYAPTLGLKADWAIGAPASRVWAEIWPDIGPRIDYVLTAGRATWDERLLLFLERSGVPEETYHTFSYSPLPDDRGRVRGMLCVVTEDTERVIGERRTALLGALAKALAPARTEPEVFEAFARCVDAAPHDLPFTFGYLCDAQGAPQEVGRSGVAGGAPAAAVGPQDWPLRAVLETGTPAVLDDAALIAGLPRGPWSRPADRAVLLPIASQGEALPAGVLVAGVNPFRPLDDGYLRFLDLAVGQLSAALASARAWETGRRRNEELAELDRAKTTFFSNVSHELRTPLTLMMGPTQAALGAPGGAFGGEDLALVHRNQQRLLRLVNSLLDIARIEAGRMQPVLEPLDLAVETAQVASVFRSAFERAGLRFEVACAPPAGPVWANRDMWEKIVLNLLSNAFKYTFEGGVRVSLDEEGGRAVLRVQDTGIGIPAAELPRLFDRFHRVEGAAGRTMEGTGIGLALVRELAALQRGEVAVESAPGAGTTFVVALPIAPPREAAAARPPEAAGGLRGAGLLDEALRWLPEADGDDEGARPAPAPAPGAGVPATAAVAGAPAAAPRAAAAAAAAAETPPAAAAARARLLVGDDNADMRAYLRRLLQARWEVATAADGVEALELARRAPPDLVLTDVMMPRLDGVGLLAALRADPRTATVPVVMLSARAGEEARLDGLRAGADDYLAKPFGARELVARIEALLALARARREALRREEELKAETRSVLEAIQEGYLALDEAGRIEQVNAAATAMAGRPRERLLGADFRGAFPTLQGLALETALQQARASGQAVHVEHRAVKEDLWYEVSVYPTPRGLVLYIRDISDRQRALVALRQADRRKDEFLATLAHELRNPLAPIRSAAEILGSTRLGDEEIALTRDVLRRQTQHMSRLLDDLLDVSRITRGRLELKKEPTTVGAIIETAVEAARALMRERLDGLHVEVADRARLIDADPVRVAQILTNLLTNAAKYSDPGGGDRADGAHAGAGARAVGARCGHGHDARADRACLRPVRAVRGRRAPHRGRPRHRARAGARHRGAARRHGGGPQRRPGARRRVRRAAAAARGGRRRRRAGGGRRRRRRRAGRRAPCPRGRRQRRRRDDARLLPRAVRPSGGSGAHGTRCGGRGRALRAGDGAAGHRPAGHLRLRGRARSACRAGTARGDAGGRHRLGPGRGPPARARGGLRLPRREAGGSRRRAAAAGGAAARVGGRSAAPVNAGPAGKNCAARRSDCRRPRMPMPPGARSSYGMWYDGPGRARILARPRAGGTHARVGRSAVGMPLARQARPGA
jgi:PAS domain S-box-containing protein